MAFVQVEEREYDRLKKDADDNRMIRNIIRAGVIGVFVIAALLMAGCPAYNVWSHEMAGKAQLGEAQYNRQIAIEEANANLESEKLNAQAEIERAKGAAEARQTEGLGMTTEEYIQYLWVKKLSLADSSIIYLPSNGGIPTLTQDVLEVDKPTKSGDQ